MDRKLTQKKYGGGIIIYYKEHLDLQIDHHLTIPATDQYLTEQLWAKLSNGRSRQLLIASIYRPPDTPIKDLDSVENNIAKVIAGQKKFIILVYLNCDLKNSSLNHTKVSERMLESYHLSQHINEETRITETSKTLLDVIIAPDSMNFVTSGCLHNSISDHSLMYCVVPKKVQKPATMTKTVRSYRNFDAKNFENAGADSDI